MSIKNQLKKLSVFVQSAHTSYDRHNSELESENKLDIEKKIAEEYFENNLINAPILRVTDLLEKHPDVSTAVDIGSGAGWGSSSLSKLVSTVIAIEPSKAGIAIAQELYPIAIYPNISWNQGFAEEVLPNIKLTGPTLFMTGCVLSHLRDKEVAKICTAINAIAPAGSVLAFSECWADTSKHQIMWHIRSKDWWQSALQNWTLDFHGPLHQNGDCNMGFWGVKNK